MRKTWRIKDNKEFQHIFKYGKSFANRQLVVYYINKQNQKHFRVGLSVGKKIGNEITRNRIKRYLRQSFIELEEKVVPTLNVVVIARQPTSKMNLHEIKKSLIHVLSRQNLLLNPSVSRKPEDK